MTPRSDGQPVAQGGVAEVAQPVAAALAGGAEVVFRGRLRQRVQHLFDDHPGVGVEVAVQDVGVADRGDGHVALLHRQGVGQVGGVGVDRLAQPLQGGADVVGVALPGHVQDDLLDRRDGVGAELADALGDRVDVGHRDVAVDQRLAGVRQCLEGVRGLGAPGGLVGGGAQLAPHPVPERVRAVQLRPAGRRRTRRPTRDVMPAGRRLAVLGLLHAPAELLDRDAGRRAPGQDRSGLAQHRQPSAIVPRGVLDISEFYYR